MANDIRAQLTDYLVDVHSIEEQALQQLEKAPDIAGEPRFAEALREHLRETRRHESRVRTLLEARGATPSKVQDVVMWAGGSGFVLFARSQTDTPGKLASHALSYEALEWASYEFLGIVAERADEPEVAEIARSIRDEERAMMQRIQGLLDATAEASLEEAVRDDVLDLLRSYLADAHAIEAQSIQLLDSGKEMVKEAMLRRLFEEHLEVSRRQQKILEERLAAVGGDRSILKDMVMRLGALNWGMFFQAQPDTPGKLVAFAYAFEHLEIGGYEQLRRVADRAGDAGTSQAVEQILEEERRAAEKLAGALETAVAVTLGGQSAG